MLRDVLQSLLDELRLKKDPLVEPGRLEPTRIRIAAIIFELADSGLRERRKLEPAIRIAVEGGEAGPAMAFVDQQVFARCRPEPRRSGRRSRPQWVSSSDVDAPPVATDWRAPMAALHSSRN